MEKTARTLPVDSGFQALAEEEFSHFVADASFPCVGAKAAWNAGSYLLKAYDELAGSSSTRILGEDLERFVTSVMARTHDYATFIAVFRGPGSLSEERFEQSLWSQLQQLSDLDRENWDPSVSSDPADPRFSFSFAGRALYVVGLHPQSSRLARRFAWPVLVFNPHEQFEKLRSDGKWKRMQQTIRERDVALQGSVNPMLNDFGESSEARQYSGRIVEPEWHPPFQMKPGPEGGGGCPFAH